MPLVAALILVNGLHPGPLLLLIGLILVGLTLTGLADRIARIFTKPVIRSLQLAVGVLLVALAVEWLSRLRRRRLAASEPVTLTASDR